MIYTVTLVPSVDYSVSVRDFQVGKVNSGEKDNITPGGKGVNVSIVLANLGIKSVATGFIAGFTGKYIKHELNAMGVANDFIEVPGFSRVNMKINIIEETAINGSGPIITEENIDSLIEKLMDLDEEDILVLSGALPKTVSAETYEKIVSAVSKKGVKVIVDTTKWPLLNTLHCNPFLIKPNKEELEEIVGKKLESIDDIRDAAKLMVEQGALNVIVSLGADGAFMIGKETKETLIKPYEGVVYSTVGAGDSLIAGFIYKYLETNDIYSALKCGVYVGSATAYSKSLATKYELRDALARLD